MKQLKNLPLHINTSNTANLYQNYAPETSTNITSPPRQTHLILSATELSTLFLQTRKRAQSNLAAPALQFRFKVAVAMQRLNASLSLTASRRPESARSRPRPLTTPIDLGFFRGGPELSADPVLGA